MKQVVIFISSLIIGFLIVVGYAYAHQKMADSAPAVPAITTHFSIPNAPSNSLKGTIATMSGTVNWISRTATEPVQLRSSRSIQQGEALGTGKNGRVGVVIQNAEEIILSSNSFVNFIQMLPINLVLEQNSGSVTYENIGQSAMSVHAFDLITAINRGWAIISMDQKNHMVTVTVEKGSVTEGYEDANHNSNVVNLDAGQQFIFDDNTLTGTVEGEKITNESPF